MSQPVQGAGVVMLAVAADIVNIVTQAVHVVFVLQAPLQFQKKHQSPNLQLKAAVPAVHNARVPQRKEPDVKEWLKVGNIVTSINDMDQLIKLKFLAKRSQVSVGPYHRNRHLNIL